jgi:hypothetical protein
MPNPLASPADYETFVYALPDRYPSIERSSLVYILLLWSLSSRYLHLEHLRRIVAEAPTANEFAAIA